MTVSDPFSGLKTAIARLLSRVPLRSTMTVPFVVQICAVVGVTSFFSYRTAQSSIHQIKEQLQNELSGRLEEKLQSYLALPHRINQLTVNAVEQGFFELDFTGNVDSQTRFLANQLQAFPEVSWIYCGAQNQGEFLGVQSKNGNIFIAVANEQTGFNTTFYDLDWQGNRISSTPSKIEQKFYDSTQRNWYQSAIATRGEQWTPIHVDATNAYLYLTASYPVYGGNGQQKLQGVCSVDITLTDLDQFLADNLLVGKDKTVFIAERDGSLVSSSTGVSTFQQQSEDENSQGRATLDNFEDPLVQAVGKYLAEQQPDWAEQQRSQSVEFTYDGKKQWLKIVPFQDEYGLDWVIFFVIPEAAYMAEINANIRDEEVQFLESQQQLLNKYLQQTQVKLDAIRVALITE